MKKNSIALAIILIILVLTLVACGENDLDTCVHNVVIDEAVPATCTETGLTEGKHCSKCGEVLLAQTEVPALGHTAADAVKENEIAPRCTTAGSYDSVVYCSVCDAELSRETKSVDALDHNIVNHDAKAPTCTEIGWNAYVTCSRCDYTTYVEIPATGHDYKAKVTEPTCTEKGYTTYTCACGDSYIANEVPATGHSPLDAVKEKEITPDCTTAGSYDNVVYCSACDVELSRETVHVDALDHNIVNHQAQAPTCTEIGWEEYETCSRCDYTTYVEIPATGHDYKAKVTEPTCTEKGYTTYTCACGDSYIANEVPATGHSPLDAVKEKEITPDCTTAGSYDNVVYCSACDVELSRETIPVDALGHDTINHDAKAPTCTEIGWNAYVTCSRCGYTTYAEIPATGHDPAKAVQENVVASMCTTTGSYDSVVYCDTCGEELSRETIVVPTLGHDIVEHESQSPACTEIGWNAYKTCSRCGYTTYAEIPATGHDYSSDCDTICNVCEYERVSSVNHTYDNTCDTTCNDCGAVRTIEHTYANNCDASCNICGATRTPSSHVYTNNCDTSCNECGAIREIEHTYSSDCDTTCNVCGATRTTSTVHSDVNPADNSCDVCGERVSTLTFTLSDDGQSYAITDANSNISGDITIPSTYNGKPVTTIGSSAFRDCSSLTSIVIPDSVTTIGYMAFYGCDSLIYNVYDNGKYLGNESNPYLVLVEATSTSITSCEINENCKVICEYAFRDCTSLTSVTIRDSVTTIGGSAFRDCSSLTSIVIPDSVTSIGASAFYNCDRLTDVYYTGDIAGWCGISFRNGTSNPVYRADNLYIDGKLVEGELIIPDSVTTIGSYAFTWCTSLTSVTIGDSVTTIGERAFYNCSGLTSVTFGANSQLTTIGSSAFENCTSLTSITIPDSVTTIGERAFYVCYKLVEVYNKSRLNITKGSSGNGYVGYYALNVYTEEGGSKLSTDEDGFIIYTNGADKILVGYTGTETDLIIPDGIKEIYNYAFRYCDSLTNIVIPDSVTTIGSYAFFECTSLTSVTFGDNSQLTTIGYSAFSGCRSLTSIVIPDSVTTIGDQAFSYCTSLTDVYYTGTTEQWEEISIGSFNDPLTNATIHYNYVADEN